MNDLRIYSYNFPAELTDHKIKIPAEMMQNLMILHSYILVKVCRTCLCVIPFPQVLLQQHLPNINKRIARRKSSTTHASILLFVMGRRHSFNFFFQTCAFGFVFSLYVPFLGLLRRHLVIIGIMPVFFNLVSSNRIFNGANQHTKLS